MEDFSMSSLREATYNGTFSNNNFHNQKELLKSNQASAKNIEVCSTSKYDAHMLQLEMQNIRHNQPNDDSINLNSLMDCKMHGDLPYELNDLPEREDISLRNQYEDLLGFQQNQRMYDLHSQGEFGSGALRQQMKKNFTDQGFTSQKQQSYSSQPNQNGFTSNQEVSHNGQQNIKQIQQNNEIDPLDGNFSLAQNNDITQDEMLLDNNEFEGQIEEDEESSDQRLEPNSDSNDQFKKQANKLYHIKTFSEQQLTQQQQQGMNVYRLSDSNPLLPLHDSSNVKQKQTKSNPQNFKVFTQKKKNNFLTSEEESNVGILNSAPQGMSSQYSKTKQQQLLSEKGGQENNMIKYKLEQSSNEASQTKKSDIEGCDYEDEDNDGYQSQTSGLNVQFVTLQNDLGDSMQKKNDQNQYFHINHSLQGSFNNEFLFNNQSAHFSTMNPQHLENCQQQYQLQQSSKGYNTTGHIAHRVNANNLFQYKQQQLLQQSQKIKVDDEREKNFEQQYDPNQSPYTPNRLYNVQQTTEQSNRSSARMVEQSLESNQKNVQDKSGVNQYGLNILQNNGFGNNQQNMKGNIIKNQTKQKCQPGSSSSYHTTLEHNEQSYKTIDLNDQKRTQSSSNQVDQEVMQKIYKKNQELALENSKLKSENQTLKQEFENMKTSLLKKYEDVRKNNEGLFKSFEEQSSLMLKKQKEKYEEKIQKLQIQLRDAETQNLFKKDNFRDRNNQLYAMVLKLEREKQELHDKNLQLIKKQINIKSENHKNALGIPTNPVLDQSELDINKSHLSQPSIPYRKLKMGVDESTLNLENQSTIHYNTNNYHTNNGNYQNSFCQGIISPNSFSSRYNQKSKSIDVLKKNTQWNSAINMQEKNTNAAFNGNTNTSEASHQDFKTQAEKLILEKKYDDLFVKYKKLLDENHDLRKTTIATNNEKEADKSIDQQNQSSIISPSITTVEGRLANYLNQQSNPHFLSQQTNNNFTSQQTNNNSTQYTNSYYVPNPIRDNLLAKPHSKGGVENSANTSILSKDRSNSYYANKKTINFNTGSNHLFMYDPMNNSSTQEEQETANVSKTDSSYANILLHHNYQTQDSSHDTPLKALKKKSIYLNYYNPKYFGIDANDKENIIHGNNKTINFDQMSDQNPCSLVRMNNYVLSSKYTDETKLKKKSSSKNKELKKRKQSLNKSNLDVSGVREKNKRGSSQDDKENKNFSNNIIKAVMQQEKPKKTRSNSVAKTPINSNKTTINIEKDSSIIEAVNKQQKKTHNNNHGVNSSKGEIKRSSSNNNKGSKTPIFSKIKV